MTERVTERLPHGGPDDTQVPSGSWAPRQGYQRPGATLSAGLSAEPSGDLSAEPVHPGRVRYSGLRGGSRPGARYGARRAGPSGPARSVPSSGPYAQVSGLPADWDGQTEGTGTRRRWRQVVFYALTGAGVCGLVWMLWMISLSSSGLSDVALGVLLAVVPLLVVLAVVVWIDRWEPQPVRTLVVAFFWGAGVAAGISAAVNTWVQTTAASDLRDMEQAQTLATVVSAPLVEEATKGLGVLVVFLVWRRLFNGAVDGLVYAAVTAAGFAFAENIVYFIEGRSMLLVLFVARGVFSPFAHVTFTGFTGVAIGLSARRRSRQAWVWWTPAGLVPAVTLHAFWNGVVAQNLLYYVIIEVPLFLACVGAVVWMRRAERMTMRRRLDEYGRQGWFAYPEVMMLTTASGRTAARRWAKARGPVAVAAMSRFQQGATQLARLRQQAEDGHAEPDFASSERELLAQVTQARKVFLGGAPGG